MLQLYIGNKNYSSWSMRAWVLLRGMDIEFEEIKIRFDSFEADSQFKNALRTVGGAGKVPLLRDGDVLVWDSLAITEYVAEKFPQKAVWPQDSSARALARSVCAEMHSGFTALRSRCPMNIEADLREQGALIWRDQATVRADVARLIQLWEDLLQRFNGPYLFGSFTAADAYFAPVCMRLHTYGLPVPPHITQYLQTLQSHPAIHAWIQDALAEKDFREFEEPYRLRADV